MRSHGDRGNDNYGDEMTAGFLLTGHDNDSYMLGEETRKAISPEERQYFDWRFTYNGDPHPATCKNCGRKTDHKYINPDFKLRKKRMDVSSTYDGYTIVSERFREFCKSQNLSELEFIPLSITGYYWLLPQEILVVDREMSVGLRLTNQCPACNAFAGVFGTSSLRFVNIEAEIPDGIFRSDLEFSQAHEQHPLIVVSYKLGTAIAAQKFKGISLTKIEY